jgi:hypothetical protein
LPAPLAAGFAAAPSAPKMVASTNSVALMRPSLLLHLLRNNSFVSGATGDHTHYLFRFLH